MRELFQEQPELENGNSSEAFGNFRTNSVPRLPRVFLPPIMHTVMYGTGDDGTAVLVTDAVRRGVREVVGTLIVEFGSVGLAPPAEMVRLEEMAGRYLRE